MYVESSAELLIFKLLTAVVTLCGYNFFNCCREYVVSLSEKDFDLFKERLVEVSKQFMETVKPSKEEVLVGLTMDYFKISP